jgi:superfamily II DNA/RNA helicase
MREFKSGRIDILVATDIVSRGIDIDDIRLVINYDAPHDCEDYVHRIGRTARAGADGCAITFVAVDDQSRFAAIEEFIGREVFKLPIPEGLGEAPEYNPKKKSSGRGKGGRGGKGRSGGHRGGKGRGGKGRSGKGNAQDKP